MQDFSTTQYLPSLPAQSQDAYQYAACALTANLSTSMLLIEPVISTLRSLQATKLFMILTASVQQTTSTPVPLSADFIHVMQEEVFLLSHLF